MGNVYYHDITGAVPWELHREIPGIELYGCRALAISQPADWVVLPEEANRYLSEIERHYDLVGLRHGTGYMFGSSIALKRCPAHFTPSIYQFTEEIHRLFPDILWRPTVQMLGSRNYFIEHCDNLGVLRPTTHLVNYRSDRPELIRYPIEVKLDDVTERGGQWRCGVASEYEMVVERLGRRYQIQVALPPETRYYVVEYERSPSGELQLGVVVQQVRTRDGSRQYRFPVSEADCITRVTDRLATWALEQGMKGVWSYEVAVTQDGMVLPLECRPRWSEVSYPARVAARLGALEWETQSFSSITLGPERAFLLGELTYRPRMNEGVIIYNWSTLHSGRLDVLIVGSDEARAWYRRELLHRYQSARVSVEA